MSEFEDTLNDPEAMTPLVVSLTGRLSPFPGPQRVVYVSTPGAGPFMALNYAKIEARILAAMTPEDAARARAEQLLGDVRARCPEITKIWTDVSAAYRGRR